MTITNNSDNKQQPTTLFQIFESEIVQRVIHVYISAELNEPSRYIDLIHCVQTAGDHDIIYIHLNLDGGRLDTGIQIINAIRNTNATVITCLEAEAHSMASMIFLSGDEFIVNDNSIMLIHNYSGGIAGKGHEMRANVEATAKWFKESAVSIYEGFLNKTEMQRLFKGEDFWFHPNEIRRRLEKMIKSRQGQESDDVEQGSNPA